MKFTSIITNQNTHHTALIAPMEQEVSVRKGEVELVEGEEIIEVGGHLIVCYWISEGFLYRQINEYRTNAGHRTAWRMERWLTDDVDGVITNGMEVVCPDLLKKIDQEIEDAIYAEFAPVAISVAA